MKKIEIYNEHREDEVLRVNLVYDTCGVKVIAVYQDGEKQKEGNILRIGNDGRLHRYSGISEYIGLCLDENGRIQSN